MSHQTQKSNIDHKSSRKWVREAKISDTECARMLYEEIRSLMYDCNRFCGQYALACSSLRVVEARIRQRAGFWAPGPGPVGAARIGTGAISLH